MVMYFSIIGVSGFVIALLNILLGTYSFDNSAIWVSLAVVIGIVFEFAIDGLFAGIIHSFPNKWFEKDKKCFQVSKNERKFYEKLKIKSWKDKVFELGALGGFRKNKIKDPNSPEYLNLFLIESNKGIIVHIAGVIVGFLVMFILPLKYAWRIGFPIAMVNMFLNILPIMILRYNIPKLQVAYERARRQKERDEKNQSISKEKNED